MPLSRRSLTPALASVVLSLGTFAVASALPDRLPGLEAREAAINDVRKGGFLDRLADGVGIACDDYRLFAYSDAAAASQALNGWLAPQGFSFQTLDADGLQGSGEVRWRADNTSAHLYGLWRSTFPGSPAGVLQLCSGTLIDLAARAADRKQADQMLSRLQQAPPEQPAEVETVIPVGLILTLAGALGTASARWRLPIFRGRRRK